MNKTNLTLLCIGVAVLPAALMAAANSERMFIEDRDMGQLLYFTDNT